jgi:hypothetical protein
MRACPPQLSISKIDKQPLKRMKNRPTFSKKARLRLVRTLYLSGVSILFFFSAKAQETPYYQLPKNRGNGSEMMTMPNLSSNYTQIYFGASAGIKKDYASLNKTLAFELDIKKPFEIGWETTLGITKNHNYYLETGLIFSPTYLKTNFSPINNTQYPLSFTSGKDLYKIPFRIKKRILTLDRVARNAFLNLGIGCQIDVNSSAAKSEEDEIKFPLSRNPKNTDLYQMTYRLYTQPKPVSFEALLELRGLVAEKFELSIFAKTALAPKSRHRHDFNLTFFDQSTTQFSQHISMASFNFGIQAQVNSSKILKYTPTVE